ncbi:BON domain-containing protein [Calycomorphotria hydatis]|uniref:BON domain protein n=1 Tax=Calycomorphotria hydatis TaxID=2528027 RepID=A0A517T5C1_9PLAN|nr:BON domain-containing protein [Calycomorphotria hydatis]QDT63558.1 BON domain protein [Calycomorphotria hydatis]
MSRQIKLHDAHPLSEQLQSALSQSMYSLAASRLSVDAGSEFVVLRGNVDTYYHKQLAQESIRQVAGDLRVYNEIEVV